MTVSALAVEDLSFCYPGVAVPVLREVSLTVEQGAFVLLVGATGSGKTTLLRLCKPEIAPAGSLCGSIRAFGKSTEELAEDTLLSARTVGYVFQSPDNQIVCDTVRAEMAFGLENLGTSRAQMRRRVAETCYFFGMEPWFRRKTADLSGGQRQTLALAATIALRPRLLLLDEPTSMLDPVAEQKFLSLLFRLNRELGITVVVATHRPAPMAAYATAAYRVEGGCVRKVTVRDVAAEDQLPVCATPAAQGDPAVRLRDVWHRYERGADWVLRGCDVSLARGEVRALVGGNGSGKSTLLGLMACTSRPQKGHVKNDLHMSQALLPQNPKALLSCESVGEELMQWSRSARYNEADAQAMLGRVGLSDVSQERHPYDLSGGQQQLLALAKLLLTRPQLLLLDEPTKGLDHDARVLVARAIADAQQGGATVALSTHDMELVRAVATSVTMLFDGQATATEPTEQFFASSWLWAH